MRSRIKNTVAATDDDINDDVLAGGGTMGGARAGAAAASKARKAAEHAKLTRENTAYREMVKNTKAVVDDDIMDEVAGKARAGYDLHHRGK